MNHLEAIKHNFVKSTSDDFYKRATGQYYTHKSIAIQMLSPIFSEASFQEMEEVKVIDPFAGDGRLIIWLIELCDKKNLRKKWDIQLLDINQDGLKYAKNKLEKLKNDGHDIKYSINACDSFKACDSHKGTYDIVVTNPPWELLKPDTRELKELTDIDKAAYIRSMKEYDLILSKKYPLSQPKRKFAGWGTNLSRVGLELTNTVLKKGGFCSIVLPASFFADDQSVNLRKEILTNSKALDIAYYPAEARLFGKADVASASITYVKRISTSCKPKLTVFNKYLQPASSDNIKLDFTQNTDFIIPITLGTKAFNILNKIKKIHPAWGEIEKDKQEIWAGREIDETGSKKWLSKELKAYRFLKGKMVNRFDLSNDELLYADKKGLTLESITRERVAWRDISRPSQKRRIIATLVPANTLTGNSLGVVHYRNDDRTSLLSLLAIMNSLCFEFQIRFHLATGHISLSSLRKVHIPPQSFTSKLDILANLCEKQLQNPIKTEAKIEAIVARQVYNLNKDEFELILDSFDKLTEEEKCEIILEFDNLEMNHKIHNLGIANHLSSKLSELDMKIVHSVPPGGNWKNIPEDIPSKRIAQIRESYALGKGSRSTYYGRLHPEMPSYTINTYFNRPGNGCHIHYSQDRVISQREAARLQSFPDNFEFSGPQTAVNTQIGNAVPPLLAFQIAKQIEKATGRKGVFIDLFSGAGGMGLGFKWAGWKPLLANDIEPRFLATYSNNVHNNTICGSISDDSFFDLLVKECQKVKMENSSESLWILGGPPCQGFSTAGNKRSMSDERNSLFLHYKKLLELVSPDGFVFENVAGLLNMEKGQVFERVKLEFNTIMGNMTGWVLNSEDFAIPQRRKRVILVGTKEDNIQVLPPEPKTSNGKKDLFSSLKNWISVNEALSDLPPLNQGENGSHLNYISQADNDYQKLMRGLVSPEQYLNTFI